jgi:hypothetical protein
MKLTEEEWARRYLAKMGNKEPTQESIDYYISLLHEDSDIPEEMSMRVWIRDQYRHQVEMFDHPLRTRRRIRKGLRG